VSEREHERRESRGRAEGERERVVLGTLHLVNPGQRPFRRHVWDRASRDGEDWGITEAACRVGVWRAVALRRGSNGAPTPPRGARRLGPAPGPRRLRRPPGLPRPARTPASGGRTTRGSRHPCPGGATYVLCRGHCHCHCCVLLLLLPPAYPGWSRLPELRAGTGAGAGLWD
jgi:hypothetical protein